MQRNNSLRCNIKRQVRKPNWSPKETLKNGVIKGNTAGRPRKKYKGKKAAHLYRPPGQLERSIIIYLVKNKLVCFSHNTDLILDYRRAGTDEPERGQIVEKQLKVVGEKHENVLRVEEPTAVVHHAVVVHDTLEEHGTEVPQDVGLEVTHRLEPKK